MTTKKTKEIPEEEIKLQPEESTTDVDQAPTESDQNAPTDATPVKILPSGVTTIVIPYAKDLAQGIELRMALRSIAKHIRTQVNVVIIGDREPWMVEDELILTVIEHERSSDNPQIDVIEKLKMAIASPMVSDRFIWSNDDIYFVSPVTLADIEVLKAKETLKPKLFGGIYAANMQRTVDLLTNANLPIRNFATHTPVIYNKEMMVELFERFPELAAGGYLLSSVYFNYHYPDHVAQELNWPTDNWQVPVVKKEPNRVMFDAIIAKKKWLNNAESGYSDFLRDTLLELFPDASPFEGE